LKNLSRFGVIVDNVSYFGNRGTSSNNHELNKVNSELLKHINKQRKIVQKDKIIHIAHTSDDEKPIIKYAGKTRRFNYKPMSKYYRKKYKNMKNGYKKAAQCKCSKRLIQKNGYPGFAILRNESIILIGCMKFKFSYDEAILEILKVCTNESLTKIEGIVETNPINESHLKGLSDQENGINILTDTLNNLNSFSFNENSSFKDADDTNFLNEQNKLDLDDSPHSDFYYNHCVSENIVHDNDTQPLEMYTEYLKQWDMNPMSNKQSCFASDLIQEVEVNESSEDGEIIEEEIVYEMNYVEADNCAPIHNNDDQEWEIEEVVIGEDRNYNDNEPRNSTDLQLKSAVKSLIPGCNSDDYKTEHMYCTSYDETIVISDDDGDDNDDGKD